MGYYLSQYMDLSLAPKEQCEYLEMILDTLKKGVGNKTEAQKGVENKQAVQFPFRFKIYGLSMIEFETIFNKLELPKLSMLVNDLIPTLFSTLREKCNVKNKFTVMFMLKNEVDNYSMPSISSSKYLPEFISNLRTVLKDLSAELCKNEKEYELKQMFVNANSMLGQKLGYYDHDLLAIQSKYKPLFANVANQANYYPDVASSSTYSGKKTLSK